MEAQLINYKTTNRQVEKNDGNDERSGMRGGRHERAGMKEGRKTD
jgi:hypothetical protein